MMTTMMTVPTTSCLQTSHFGHQAVVRNITQAVQLSGVNHRHLVSSRRGLSMYRNDIWIGLPSVGDPWPRGDTDGMARRPACHYLPVNSWKVCSWTDTTIKLTPWRKSEDLAMPPALFYYGINTFWTINGRPQLSFPSNRSSKNIVRAASWRNGKSLRSFMLNKRFITTDDDWRWLKMRYIY